VTDPVGLFGDSFVFAVNQFLDAAVVWASMIEVDLGDELRIRGKGGCSSTSKAFGLKNPIAGPWRFLCLGKKFQDSMLAKLVVCVKPAQAALGFALKKRVPLAVTAREHKRSDPKISAVLGPH
jgi:hypothetical protein